MLLLKILTPNFIAVKEEKLYMDAKIWLHCSRTSDSRLLAVASKSLHLIGVFYMLLNSKSRHGRL